MSIFSKRIKENNTMVDLENNIFSTDYSREIRIFGVLVNSSKYDRIVKIESNKKNNAIGFSAKDQ